MQFLETLTLAIIASITLMSMNCVHANALSREECKTKAAKAKTKKDCLDIDYEDIKWSKSSKKCKCKKSKVLVALINPVDQNKAYGTTQVSYNQDGSFVVSLSLNFLSGAANGTVTITEGTSCDQSLPEYSDSPIGNWDTTDNIYQALGDFDDSTAISKSAFRYSGIAISSEDNWGKTVHIHDGTTLIGCGTLGVKTKERTLVAEMGTYPGYSDELNAAGTVTVEFDEGETFKFSYELNGLKSDCTGCGIHIHQGVSCDSHDEVMGHGYNSNLVADLWTTTGGSVYNTDSNGVGKGYFFINNGFGYEENFNHAVVIHTEGGARVGCGVLK